MNQEYEYRVVRKTWDGAAWHANELPYGPYKDEEAAQEVAKRFNNPDRVGRAVGDRGEAWVERKPKLEWERI